MGFFSVRWTGFLLVMIACFSVSVRESAATGGFPKPPNCKILECPSYKVVFSGKDFEIRSYRNALWISSPPINSSSFEAATGKGFGPLSAYIQGWNDQVAKVEMTAPVLVDVTPSTGGLCNSTFVVRFYMPQKYQNAPPSSPKVDPETWPGPRYAAVRRFGGFLNDVDIPAEAAALRNSLRGSPWKAATAGEGGAGTSTYTVAGYNSPSSSSAA
ncbi:unnamed protein product [Spirodela intermedia]|uniref:Uncharacterized protein n=1 Tax=Spirodela intermedia TaxID=51605 RepID=A0A7I8IQH9_SPIIN|nr:unnamed protein product [Spirodela intermedia]CAA6660053.1 unnamed protein product [Spirodela intermedia]